MQAVNPDAADGDEDNGSDVGDESDSDDDDIDTVEGEQICCGDIAMQVLECFNIAYINTCIWYCFYISCVIMHDNIHYLIDYLYFLQSDDESERDIEPPHVPDPTDPVQASEPEPDIDLPTFQHCDVEVNNFIHLFITQYSSIY